MAQAKSGYQTAVALYPDYEAAWCALGAIEAQDGEFAAARKSFHQAIRSDPKAICPYLPLAVIEHEARDWNALLEATDRLLRLDSVDYPIAHLLKAAAHYNLGEYAEAEQSARAAEALDNVHYPKIWEVLGWASERRGNDVSAMGQFDKYLDSVPMSADTALVRAALSRLAARHPEIPKEDFSSPTFRVETNLAQVQFQITPKRGQAIQALRPEDIEIREDGVPKPTRLFEVGRSYQTGVPVEIWLLIDCSASMISIADFDLYAFNTSLLDEYENVSVAMCAFSDEWIRFTKPTRTRELSARPCRPCSPCLAEVRACLDPSTIRWTMPRRAAPEPSAWSSFSPTAWRRVHGRRGAAGCSAGGPGTRRCIVSGDAPASRDADPLFVDEPQVRRAGAPDRRPGFPNPRGGFRPALPAQIPGQGCASVYLRSGLLPDSSDKGTRHEAQVVLLKANKGRLNGGKRIVVH